MSAASTEEQRRRKQAGDRDRERVFGQGRVQERGEQEGEDERGAIKTDVVTM